MAEVRPRSQQQPPGNDPVARDVALVTGIAALIAVGAAPRPTALKIAALIGVPAAAVAHVLMLAMSQPYGSNVAAVGSPSATGQNTGAEGRYRSAYVLLASRRVQQALANGQTVEEAMEAEQRWFARHIEAQANRRRAALAVDKAASKFGPKLGWYAKMDSRTSAECKAANGTNFTVDQVPAIGWPGAVHPFCRCRAGKPHSTSKTVYSIQTERKTS